MNILLVDDEMDQLETLRRGLKSRGYQVCEAMSAEEGLNILQDKGKAIDLIVTDYWMNGMNGIQFLETVHSQYGSFPSIIMSGHGEKNVIINSLKYHCDSFLEKPFTLDSLTTEIDRAINHNDHHAQCWTPQALPFLAETISNSPATPAFNAQPELTRSGNTEVSGKYGSSLLCATEKITETNRNFLQNNKTSKMKTVDLCHILENSIRLFTDILTSHGIAVNFVKCEKSVTMLGNRFDFEQIFNNIILNAIESLDETPGERKTISLSVRENENTGEIEATIADSGIGLCAEIKDKIFMPYFTTKKHSNGLGLHIAKATVEKYGGRIEFTYAPGWGCNFQIILPSSKKIIN